MNENIDRAPAGLPARTAALAILVEVLGRRRPLDETAATVLDAARLERRDGAFARALATTTLRRLGEIEAVMRHFVPKPPPGHRAGPTLEILLLGFCELLFLGVAPHAAVDAANRLARADAKAQHFKGLINAVLRRAAEEGPGLLAPEHAPRLDTPDWLWPRWVENFGEETATAIARAHLETPPLDLKLKREGDPCVSLLDGAELPGGVVRLRDAGRIEELAGFADGSWWVQDFAAGLPARLLGDVTGRTAIDLCAAPGGKTAQLASLGAHVVAVDRAPDRLTRVRENLARLKLAAQIVEADARDWRPETPALLVLLDAPCTATGTIRRHPDLPWIKSAADITHTSTLQAELLDAAAEMTAPGGTLLYAVCSLEPEEGIEQAESLLRRHADFRRAAIAPADVFGASELLTPAGDLRTLPCHWAEKGGMDGFYAARFRRI